MIIVFKKYWKIFKEDYSKRETFRLSPKTELFLKIILKDEWKYGEDPILDEEASAFMLSIITSLFPIEIVPFIINATNEFTKTQK